MLTRALIPLFLLLSSLLSAQNLLFTKQFTNDPVSPGSTVELQFTLANQNPTEALTGISFTDDLDAALSGLNAVGTPINDICGVGSQLSGTSLLTLTGGNLVSGASVTFSITLQVPAGATPGFYLNTTSPVIAYSTSGTPVMANPASDNLEIKNILSVAKVFDPGSVPTGGISTLKFNFINVTISAAEAVSFADVLPAGLVIATPANASSTFPEGTLVAVSGSGVITFSGGKLLAGTNATITVDVQALISGQMDNQSGDVTSSFGNSGPMSASLLVTDTPPPPIITGRINGQLTVDENRNGVPDAHECTLHQVPVILSGQNGQHIAKALSDASGQYHFKNVGIGTYTLRVDDRLWDTPVHQTTFPNQAITISIPGEEKKADLLVYSDYVNLCDQTLLDYLDNSDDPDDVPKQSNSLVFVTGSPTDSRKGEKRKCGWKNAVDGILQGWNGTTLARGYPDVHGPAWAIFEFFDQQVHRFNMIAVQTDNGPDDDQTAESRQVDRLQILVSTSGMAEDDFVPIADHHRRFNGNKLEYIKLNDYAAARYLKLVLLSPYTKSGYRQIVEFIPTAQDKKGAIPADTEAPLATCESGALDHFECYPNPFNPSTTIAFRVLQAEHIKVRISDPLGREVATLVDGVKPAGRYQVVWDATDHASGIYFVSISSASAEIVRRITLVK